MVTVHAPLTPSSTSLLFLCEGDAFAGHYMARLLCPGRSTLLSHITSTCPCSCCSCILFPEVVCEPAPAHFSSCWLSGVPASVSPSPASFPQRGCGTRPFVLAQEDSSHICARAQIRGIFLSLWLELWIIGTKRSTSDTFLYVPWLTCGSQDMRKP